MTLYEVGMEYEKSAELLRARLKELRIALKQAENAEERFYIKRRIAELTPMLTQCNRLAEYCTRYYEPGYYIGNGALEPRKQRVRQGAVKQLSTQDSPLHIEKRTYTKTGPSRGGVFDKRENVPKRGGRTRRKQNDCLQELLSGVK